MYNIFCISAANRFFAGYLRARFCFSCCIFIVTTIYVDSAATIDGQRSIVLRIILAQDVFNCSGTMRAFIIQ